MRVKAPTKPALILALMLMSTSARADANTLSMGTETAWNTACRLRQSAISYWGVNDVLALFVAAHIEVPQTLQGGERFGLTAGPTWLWDVWTVVPALTVAAGYQVHPGAPFLLGRAEVRGYLAPRWFINGQAGLEYHPDGWRAAGGIGLFYQLW